MTARIKSVKPIFPRWAQETGYTLRTWERTRNQRLPPSMASGDLKLTTTSQNPIGMSSFIPTQFTLRVCKCRRGKAWSSLSARWKREWAWGGEGREKGEGWKEQVGEGMRGDGGGWKCTLCIVHFVSGKIYGSLHVRSLRVQLPCEARVEEVQQYTSCYRIRIPVASFSSPLHSPLDGGGWKCTCYV